MGKRRDNETSASGPQVPRLVYDSADEPPRPGVRSHRITHRHQLYIAGSVYCDLRFERDATNNRTHMVGQLTDSSEPGREWAGTPVLLRGPGSILGTCSTDWLGEFHLAYQPVADMSLDVRMTEERPLQIPIDRRMSKRIATAPGGTT